MPRKNKEQYNAYMREYMLKRYYERRKYAIEQLGSRCAECGSTDQLEIDHIDPKKKSFDVGKLWSTAWARFIAELKKCQLLCDTHHNDKTLAHKGQRRAKGTHGTLSAYKYCRCDRCRDVHSAYCREYSRKRREARRSSTG